MHSNENGRSMLEMFGVLVIMGVLSAGGMLGFSKMQNQARVNDTVMQIKSMATKLSAFGSKSGTYDGLSNATLSKLNIDPSVDFENPFGGTIEIKPSKLSSSGGTTDKRAFLIVYKGLPQEACIKLAGVDWIGSGNTNLLGVTVAANATLLDGQAIDNIYHSCNGANVSGQYAVGCVGSASNPVPIDLNVATGACNCSASECAIALKYY